MTNREDIIDNVKLELAELKRLDGISQKDYAAALKYIERHEDEVVQTASYSSITDTADMVVTSARICSTGGCE